MSDYKDMKNTDKYTIISDISNDGDISALNVVWSNNGLYTPECVGTPIIDEQNRVVIGMITQCDDKYVRGVIWAKKSVEHFFDGKMASISFEIGKVK